MTGGSGFRLGIRCCFCGGALDIDEASHTIQCAHCASCLRIIRPEGVPRYYIEDDLSGREVKFLVDRHLKKSNRPLVSGWRSLNKVYLPFWRVTGTAISILDCTADLGDNVRTEDCNLMGDTPEAFETRIVPRDVSFAADDSFTWGVDSLGVRTQVIRLLPLENDFEQSHNLAPVSMDYDQAVKRFHAAVASVATLGPYTKSDIDVAVVDLRVSQIYFPIWLGSFDSREGSHLAQLDAVTRRVVRISAGDVEISPSGSQENSPAVAVTVQPHRCPNCGVDLPVAERSVTFFCNNCRRLYLQSGDHYRQLEVSIPKNVSEEHRLFPFWIFNLKKSEWEGKKAVLKALKLARLRAGRFFVPAFAVANPSRLMRLIRHYNRRPNGLRFRLQSAEHYDFTDVIHTPEDAAALVAPLAAAAAAKEGYRLRGTIDSGAVDSSTARLVWLPFSPNRYFWQEQITGATIEKAAVRCGC